MSAPPAGPKRRTLAEFGRELRIGDRWQASDGSVWRIDQVWRTDRLAHLVAESGDDQKSVMFTRLRDKWRRVTADCPQCGGSGELRWNPSRHVPPDPQLEQWQTCPTCNGSGGVGA